MARAARTHLSRQLLAASLVFGALFFAVIALFGWLIFRSLSQREVERVLLETRAEAESLAKQIARQAERQGKDLFTAVAVEQETQTYIDSVLRQRDFVRTVEIRDRNGLLGLGPFHRRFLQNYRTWRGRDDDLRRHGSHHYAHGYRRVRFHARAFHA